MPNQVDDALLHAMSGTELSRVRTELRLLLREHINQRLLASRAADIVTAESSLAQRAIVGLPWNKFANDKLDLTASQPALHQCRTRPPGSAAAVRERHGARPVRERQPHLQERGLVSKYKAATSFLALN